MATTLAELMRADRVPFDDLHRRYHPVLGLVEILIGVVPNCDPYLEIWRPGFRTYNLMVPAFLNLPASLMNRSAPKDVSGLALYASSRAASCAYCSAHTCSYALRRGSTAGAVTGESRTAAEAAVVAVAEALSTMPHHYRADLGEELCRHYSPDHAEWIVMGVANMGFLNKFMDAIGVELEAGAVSDVADLIEPTGWAIGQHGWAGVKRPEGGTADPPPRDSLGTLLRVMRNAPGAIRLEREWTRGIPSEAAASRRHIADTYGWDEPLLTTMGPVKPRRALAAMLRHNLDPDQSVLGLDTKALVGLVFAVHADNEGLAAQARALATRAGVDPALIDAVASGPSGPAVDDRFEPRMAAALAVAEAIAPSPAMVTTDTIETAEANLSSAEIIEVAVWVSVNQLLHRLSVYYDPPATGS